MKTIIGFEEIPPTLPYPVVAIGNFDGLHIGHQAVLAKTIAHARAYNGTAVVLTFKPHPSQITSPKQPAILLTPFEEKLRFLELFGIDAVIYVEFNKEFAHQTPTQFAQHFLAEKIGCKKVVVGEHFMFGKNRSGSVTDLTLLGEKFGFSTIVQKSVIVQGRVASSSTIRQLLQEGNVKQAAVMLSAPYTIRGKVVQGDRAGRVLGFPTANIHVAGRLIPKSGIYAMRVSLPEHPSPINGVGYIRSQPVVGKMRETLVEAHLLDYNKDLYGQDIEIAFIDWIRPDARIHDHKALIKQIQNDVKKARLLLASTRSVGGIRKMNGFPPNTD